MKNSGLQVNCLLYEGFPNGMAQSNRILSIAKGLQNNNIKFKIIIVRPTERKEKQINYQRKGIVEGIKFEYITKSLIWPEKKASKLWELIKGHINVLKYLKHQREEYDIIISSYPKLFYDIVYKVFSIFLHKPFIVTIDEYPEFIRYNKYHYFIKSALLHISYKTYDGFIIMTKRLIDFYKPLARKNVPFLHLPMTVDFTRFDNQNTKNINLKCAKYITYCGNLGQYGKDGVDILIGAFKLVKMKFKYYKLLLIGGTSTGQKYEIVKLKDLVIKYELESDVVFTGKVERNLIPSYLMNSEILALARPNNKQAEGGFPTKLGEYLASRKPVVVTRVGEIPDYLTDDSAYLSEPGSVEEFAKTLLYAIEDKNKDKVGTNGYKVAKQHFDYLTQGEKLANFLIRNFK